MAVNWQRSHGKGGSSDRKGNTGYVWSWPVGSSGAGPIDPADVDTNEANASMAMLPPIPCRQVVRTPLYLAAPHSFHLRMPDPHREVGASS